MFKVVVWIVKVKYKIFFVEFKYCFRKNKDKNKCEMIFNLKYTVNLT